MKSENFCTFILGRPSYGDLRVLHYVYETELKNFTQWRSVSFCRMHFVTDGEGVLYTQSGEFALSEGDVFFIIPGMPCGLDTSGGLKYIYVGCIGERVNELVDLLKITPATCVFHGRGELKSLWWRGVGMSSEMLKFYGEGVFYATAAVLGEGMLRRQARTRGEVTAAMRVKQVIDDSFTECDLTLESVCKRLSYSPKYISAAFRREYGFTFKEYLSTVRINNALALMERGFVGIKNISTLSGFSDPLYFSKVFKQRQGLTPSEQIAEFRRQLKKE